MLLGLKGRPCLSNYLAAFTITTTSVLKIHQYLQHHTLLPPQPKHPQHLVSLLLKDPTSRKATQQVHSHILTSGFLLCPVSTTIASTYILLLNTLIRCYSLGLFPLEAFTFYRCIHQHIGSLPSFTSFDSFTYSFLFHACANSSATVRGIQLHALTIKMGFQFHVYVQTALLQMYSACGLLVEALHVLEKMPERSSVTWNVLITSLIKWGKLALARSIFDQMPDRTIVSWTVIIDGYTRMNQPIEALIMFRNMVILDGIKPSEITLLVIFPTVSNIGNLKICQLVHSYAEKTGFHASDVRISNSLVDSYAKCGCLASATRFFEEISQRKNLVSWTSIISCFAMHGLGREAAEHFGSMEKSGLKPNLVTFLSVLSACSHGGLVEEGLKFFNKMVNECQLVPNIKHYGCLIDMLGRIGRLEEAEKIALEIPLDIVNVVIWRTLLGACGIHGNVDMAERVTRKILETERQYGGDYVLMSNIFSGVGRFGDAEMLRQLMGENLAPKIPGHSLV